MIGIGICDDITQQLLAQEKMVRDIMLRLCINAEVKCFKSGEDLLCEIEQKGDMDLILLDIEMGGINGVEAARIIREKDSRAILIFISSHDQYFGEMNTFYKKLDEVEKQLARMDAKFLRISKSYLINASHIREFRYEKIVMDDGRELSIGSGYKGKIRQSYMELMQES